MEHEESIMTQIQKVEEVLNESMYQLELLTKKLRNNSLTIDSREELEVKLKDIRKVLAKNKEALKSLRKQNTKSFMVAASTIFACFLLYVLLYSMFLGPM